MQCRSVPKWDVAMANKYRLIWGEGVGVGGGGEEKRKDKTDSCGGQDTSKEAAAVVTDDTLILTISQ